MATTKKTETAKKAETTKATAKKNAEKAEKEVKAAAATAKKSAEKAKKNAEKAEKEVKAAAATAKKSAKRTAQKLATKEFYFEFAGKQVNTDEIYDAVEKAYVASGKKASAIKSIKLYVKAEDNAVYYVINDKENGKVEL